MSTHVAAEDDPPDTTGRGYLPESFRDKLLVIGFVLALIAIGLNTYQGFHNSNSLSNTNHQTCLVQARGLSAQPHLTAAMSDIGFLITPGKENTIPPKILAKIVDLRTNLGVYVGIESQQPKKRNC